MRGIILFGTNWAAVWQENEPHRDLQAGVGRTPEFVAQKPQCAQMLWPKQGGAGRAIKNDHGGAFNDMARLMQLRVVEFKHA
jgi:hypothetical protein